MFNRALQVKMVKNDKSASKSELPADVLLEDKCTIISAHFQKSFRTVANAIVAYVVVDTIRQVLIAKANRPT